MNPIEEFLAEVERRNVAVEGRVLRQAVDEMRDHLEQAAMEYRAQGLGTTQAQVEAVRSFGVAPLVFQTQPVWKRRSVWLLPFLFWASVFGSMYPGLFSWVPTSFFETQIPTVFTLAFFGGTMGVAGYFGRKGWWYRSSVGIVSGLVFGIVFMLCTSYIAEGPAATTYVGSREDILNGQREVSQQFQRLKNIDHIAQSLRSRTGLYVFPREANSYRNLDELICETDRGWLSLRQTASKSEFDLAWNQFNKRRPTIERDYAKSLAGFSDCLNRTPANLIYRLKNTSVVFFSIAYCASFAVVCLGQLVYKFTKAVSRRRRPKATA